MNQALCIHNLRKHYRRRAQEVVAVNDISFEVAAGSVVGLLGPNGAGKTTTIKCALGLVTPTAGEIRVAGLDVQRRRGRVLRQVGAVLEGNRNIYWYLTALENLTFFGNLAGIPTAEARRRGRDLLERFGLAEKANTRAGQLSRGMQQKVAICAALIRQPRLLLLDEPTLGLDVETAAQMRALLLSLAHEQGHTVIISSHQLELIEAICERVVIMHQGRIVAQDRVDQLLTLFATRSYRFWTEGPLPSLMAERLRARFPRAAIYAEGASIAIGTAIGTTIDITFDQGQQLYEVMRLFAEGGVTLRTLEHRTPNLEAVFLRLIRESTPLSEVTSEVTV